MLPMRSDGAIDWHSSNSVRGAKFDTGKLASPAEFRYKNDLVCGISSLLHESSILMTTIYALRPTRIKYGRKVI